MSAGAGRPSGSEPLDARLREIVSPARVRARIAQIADELAHLYRDLPLVLVVIAEGARRFGDALVDALEAQLVFPQVLVVHARRTRGTDLEALQIDPIDLGDLQGRDVVLVDDIADEGVTLEALSGLVDEAEPASRELAVLVSKTGRRCRDLDLRYVGFEVDRGWVVGFGMDLDGRFRELDCIAVVEGTE